MKDEYLKAVRAINEDYYNYDNLLQVIEALIEEYLLKEGGRLGKIVDGKYEEPLRSRHDSRSPMYGRFRERG